MHVYSGETNMAWWMTMQPKRGWWQGLAHGSTSSEVKSLSPNVIFRGFRLLSIDRAALDGTIAFMPLFPTILASFFLIGTVVLRKKALDRVLLLPGALESDMDVWQEVVTEVLLSLLDAPSVEACVGMASPEFA